MKRKLIFTLLFFIASKTFSQSKIDNDELGYFFDINYQMLDGYYDIDYEPENSLEVLYTIGEDFTPGYYYDLRNHKISGLLKYSRNNADFKFKVDSKANAETIKPEGCSGYVIGVDSFAIIQNFDVEREIGAFRSANREFAEVIERFGNLTFYKHTRVGLNNDIVTYIVRDEKKSSNTSFPKGNNKFIETAIPIFGEFESLKDQLLAKKFSEEDIPILIKLLKYKRKYENHEKIYYNSSWDEVDDHEKSSYYATINSLKDSLFHLSFYSNKGLHIYDGYFTSFYPHKKTGDFQWYNHNGTIRKKITYQYNKPIKTITYFKNGNVHYEYNLVDKIPFFSKVLNTQGGEVLNSSGNGIEIFYDSIVGRQLTHEFINNTLANSYYLDSNKKRIYQLCERNAKLQSFSTIQDGLKTSLIYPINSVKDFKHGFALVKFIVEPTGFVSEIQILKSIDSDCNKLIVRSLWYTKTQQCWKPAKVGKEKVAQELILPIDFSIQGFSRYRNNYNNFYNNMMMNQMMQQQMMNPKIPSNFHPKF